MKKLRIVFAVAVCLVSTVAAEGLSDKNGKSNSFSAYMAYQEDEVKFLFDEFTKDTGIQVHFVRLSAGEVFTRMQAEKENPRVNLVQMSIDTIAAAAKEGLIESFTPSNIQELPKELQDPNGSWIAHSISVLCFASNEKWVKENNIVLPKSWDDLLKPEFKGNISVAHPGTSGVAYAWLSGLVSLMGENQALAYMKKLDKSIVQYTKGGAAPARMAGLGEAGVGLCWSSDAINTINSGYSLLITYPKEGSPYEITGLGLIKNGPSADAENAKRFIEWAIGKKGQELFGNTFNRLPVNKNAALTNDATPFAELNTIKVDRKFASENRSRLIQRFVNEVRSSDNVLK